MNLSGNTILITGGSSGIGFELAKQLVQSGNKVIIVGRSASKLQQAKTKLPQLNTIVGDVGQLSTISTLFEKVIKDFPETNVLINNAGIMKTINLHDAKMPLEQLTEEIQTNLMGPVWLTQKFLPHLKKQNSAAIVNVSSGLAFVPLPTSPVYCATKAALHSFTLSLRVQLKNTKIKVFECAPPATQTELLAGHDQEDMKGIPIMKVEEMVARTIEGMKKDIFEIRPGQSNALNMMSRIAPKFILKQLSRPVDRMLSKPLN